MSEKRKRIEYGKDAMSLVKGLDCVPSTPGLKIEASYIQTGLPPMCVLLPKAQEWRR